MDNNFAVRFGSKTKQEPLVPAQRYNIIVLNLGSCLVTKIKGKMPIRSRFDQCNQDIPCFNFNPTIK